MQNGKLKFLDASKTAASKAARLGVPGTQALQLGRTVADALHTSKAQDALNAKFRAWRADTGLNSDQTGVDILEKCLKAAHYNGDVKTIKYVTNPQHPTEQIVQINITKLGIGSNDVLVEFRDKKPVAFAKLGTKGNASGYNYANSISTGDINALNNALAKASLAHAALPPAKSSPAPAPRR